MEKSTDGLLSILRSAPPEQVGALLEENKAELYEQDRPFSAYLRELLKHHKVSQQDVIRKAGFSDKYGYRLLAEDRHTRQRDYILRICLAANLTLDETQRLLRLYGMSPLYARLPRDAVLISAISAGGYSIEQVNSLLSDNRMAPLRASSEDDSTISGG